MRGNIDIGFELGLLVEFQGALADIDGHVADPFQIGGDFQSGGDEAQVAAGGLVQRQKLDAQIVDIDIETIHFMVALDNDFGAARNRGRPET